MSTGLDMRVSATTYDLEDLVTDAWEGRIRVPHFQRDFRWTLQDVIRLFDSIVKGYPVGSLLLWVREADAQRIRLGALDIDAPQVQQALWVVDGQQRITSLANALHSWRRGRGHYTAISKTSSSRCANGASKTPLRSWI